MDLLGVFKRKKHSEPVGVAVQLVVLPTNKAAAKELNVETDKKAAV